MIYALTFSWERGQQLAWLQNQYLNRYNVKHIIYFDEGQHIEDWILYDFHKNDVTIKYKTDYHGGHNGWKDSMKKIAAYKEIIKEFNMNDDDWLMDMDEDTIVGSNKIFALLNNKNSLIGIRHEPEFMTEIGMFGHMSGACVAMRGEYLKKLCEKEDGWFTELQKEFKRQTLTEMWDVVISYGMEKVGAKGVNMAKQLRVLTGGDPELWGMLELFVQGKEDFDYFHLNETCKIFMGEPCLNSRYDIPRIINKFKNQTNDRTTD